MTLNTRQVSFYMAQRLTQEAATAPPASLFAPDDVLKRGSGNLREATLADTSGPSGSGLAQ